MRSIMRQTFVRFEARDRGDTALRLVQKIGRRAEGAAHRAIVERDQPHRANLREVRLARRLARQRPDAIGGLETLPVGRIRHLLVGSAEDRVAQLVATQRTLRNATASLPSVTPLRRAGDAAQRIGRRAGAPRARAAAARLHRAPPDRTVRARTSARDETSPPCRPRRSAPSAPGGARCARAPDRTAASSRWSRRRPRPRRRSSSSRSSARCGGSRQQFGSKTFASTPADSSTPASRQTPSGGARKVYSPQCGSYGPINNTLGDLRLFTSIQLLKCIPFRSGRKCLREIRKLGLPCEARIYGDTRTATEFSSLCG